MGLHLLLCDAAVVDMTFVIFIVAAVVSVVAVDLCVLLCGCCP